MPEVPRAERFLGGALLANVLVHALALVGMAACIMPGLPGGPSADVADRAAYVAGHPWLWRLGWLPWHLCALADLVMGVALVCTGWLPRLPAWLTLLVTISAVIPEQTGEITWVTRGVTLAAEAAGDPGAVAAYKALEDHVFSLAVVWGASLYMVMAAGWTWCFAATGTWSPALTWLSVLTWGSLAVGSLGLLLPAAYRPGDLLVAVSNASGFPLLVVWLWLVRARVLARGRPSPG